MLEKDFLICRSSPIKENMTSELILPSSGHSTSDSSAASSLSYSEDEQDVLTPKEVVETLIYTSRRRQSQIMNHHFRDEDRGWFIPDNQRHPLSGSNDRLINSQIKSDSLTMSAISQGALHLASLDVYNCSNNNPFPSRKVSREVLTSERNALLYIMR